MSLRQEQASQRRLVSARIFGHPWPRAREAIFIAGMLAPTGGCNFIVNSEQHQCETPEDCAKAFGGAAASFTCEETLCVASRECNQSSDCTAPGRSVCSEGLCVACAVASDCASPTAQCVASACVDPTWGCLLDADNRPSPTQATASLSVKAINVFTSAPISGLAVRACRPAVLDVGCSNLLPGATASYNEATGDVSVVGLPNGTPFRLKLDPPQESGILRADYYSNRTPRGAETSEVLSMLPAVAISGIPTDIPIDIKRASITAHVYDCQGKSAPGVVVTLADLPTDLVTIYLDDTMIPRRDLTSTSSAGIATLINVKSGVAVTLLAKINPTMNIDFQLVALGETSTFVDLHPRVFRSQ